MSKVIDQIELYKQIFEVQNELKSVLDPNVWDYAFLFNIDNTHKIEIKNTTLQIENLLTKFNDLCNKLFESSGMPVQKGKDSIETFNLVLHLYYILRFLEAKMLYADYEYLRIMTPTELKIQNAAKGSPWPEESDISFSIKIPNSIKKTKLGEVEINSTIRFENEEDAFKIFCTCSPQIKFLTGFLLETFENETTLKIPLLLFPEDFVKIFSKSMEVFLKIIAAPIYDYIDKGYSVQQSKVNVFEYIKTMLNKQGNSLSPLYKSEEEQMIAIIRDVLSQNKAILPKSIEVFVSEIIEFIIKMFLDGEIMPENIYDVSYREANPNNPNENSFDYICDLYLMTNSGRYPEFAIESYALALTPKSKTDMFGYITQGIENPNFPLEYIIEYI